MLRGILYDIVTVDGSGVTLRLLPESPVYKGHFPGYPITPGVCLVEMALEAIGQMAGHDGPVKLVAAKNIKFSSPVFPGEGTELRFNISGEGENRTVDILNGEVLSARMSLTVA